MAKNFSTQILRLGNQIVTATGNTLYLNGALAGGSGNYDPFGTAANSGQILYNDILGLSGAAALDQDLTTTGQTLYGYVTGLSGANVLAYATTANLTSTGQALFNNDVNTSGFANRKSQMHVQFSVGTTAWGAMPNAVNFYTGSSSYITYLDLTNFTGVNLVVNRGAAAGSTSGALYLGYSALPSVTASTYLPLSTTLFIRLGQTSTIITSGFQPMVAGARSGVYVALLGSSGSVAASPNFGMISAIFM